MTLWRRAAAWIVDRRGNVGVMAAALIPAMVLLIGAAVDYSRAEQIREKMQHAVDSAVLAVANNQLLEGKNEEAQVKPFLDANLSNIGDFKVTNVYVEQDGDGYALVRVTGEAKNHFLGTIGQENFTLVTEAIARYQRERDLEISVLIDNSPSMLIGATEQTIKDMEKDFGCAFACHYGNGKSYKDAKTKGYELRLDAAKDAVNRAFKIAKESDFAQAGDIYFDVSIFNVDTEFVARGEAATLLGSAGDKVRAIEPVPQPKNNKYEVTNGKKSIASATTSAKSRKTKYADRQHFFLIITDGVADYREGSRKIEPIYGKNCDDLKNAGIRVGVIYTTYFQLPSNNFWKKKVKPFDSQIGPEMQKCASPGWYFEAQYAEDIDRAFDTLMSMAIPRPRLTN